MRVFYIEMRVFYIFLSCLAVAAAAAAAAADQNMNLSGKVYCHNYVGFPRISHPIAGALFAVECKDHAGKRLFYNEGSTDDDGFFSIFVKSEHMHEHCEAYTMGSPSSCNIPFISNRVPVSLTHKDIDSNERKIGPFAFRSIHSQPACQSVMAEYSFEQRARPASVIRDGMVHTNGARHLLSSFQSFQSRTRDCCGDDYCPYCKQPLEAEEEAAGDPDPYTIESGYIGY